MLSLVTVSAAEGQSFDREGVSLNNVSMLFSNFSFCFNLYNLSLK